ncbi:MAG: hypothetical protein VX304_06240, partial [Planctomycetota bacterium]|nr:hypothetical protein [Planctomycetota bacterium]
DLFVSTVTPVNVIGSRLCSDLLKPQLQSHGVHLADIFRLGFKDLAEPDRLSAQPSGRFVVL